jgi:hypothetical protein
MVLTHIITNNEVTVGSDFGLELILSINPIKTKYMRRYMTLQDLAAKVGGVIKLFMLITTFVNLYITEPYFFEHLYQNYYSNQFLFFTKNSKGEKKLPFTKVIDKNTSNKLVDISMNASDLRINNFQIPVHIRTRPLPPYNPLGMWKSILRIFSKKKDPQNIILNRMENDYKNKFEVRNVLHSFNKINEIYDYTYTKIEQTILEMMNSYKLICCSNKNYLIQKTTTENFEEIIKFVTIQTNHEKLKITKEFKDYMLE